MFAGGEGGGGGRASEKLLSGRVRLEGHSPKWRALRKCIFRWYEVDIVH